MSQVRYHEVSAEEAGQRLDNLLIRLLKGVPRSFIYRIIRAGEVRINKKRAQVSTRLQQGDAVRIPPVRCAQEKSIQVSPALALCLEKAILYEDKDFMVLNKPTGLAVHGGSGLSLGLIEALRLIRSDLKYLELVHRLDKETSGCILIAKKRSMLRELQSLLVKRAIEKTYWTLLANPWRLPNEYEVYQPLKKNILQSGERIVTIAREGKEAQTHFHLLENYQNCCLVEVKPQTGRTHQIRVHSAYLEHPIIGDEKYGKNNKGSQFSIKPRLYLHARALRFVLNDKVHNFQANLDKVYIEALSLLRNGPDAGEQ